MGVGSSQWNLPISTSTTIPAASVTDVAYQTATLGDVSQLPSFQPDPPPASCDVSVSTCYEMSQGYGRVVPCDGPWDIRMCNGKIVESQNGIQFGN